MFLFQAHIDKSEPQIRKEDHLEFIDAEGIKWTAEKRRTDISLIR